MTNPIHLLSVASLLLVAFLVGAAIGTLLRLIALRAIRKPAAVVEAPVEAKAEAPPLVATPVIAPLPIAPTPAPPAPAEVPVPDFAATLIALADEAPPAAFLDAVRPTASSKSEPAPAAETASSVLAMQPARTAGETTSGLRVAAPLHETTVEAPERAEQRSADVIPFPIAALETPTEQPTALVIGGEAVTVVDTSDLVPDGPLAPVAVEADPEPVAPAEVIAEDEFLIVGEEAFIVPEAEKPAAVAQEATSDTVPIPAIVPNAAVAAVAVAELPVPEVVTLAAPSAPNPEPTEPIAEAEVEPAPALPAAEAETVAPAVEPAAAAALAEVPPAAEPELEAKPEPTVVSADEPIDEDAAMRAIEGNWSPRRSPVRTPRPVAAPEGVNQAVAASARAVTAARRTAEAVIAEVAEVQAEVKAEAGRPAGLDQPRDGRKDDLTHIIGVLPVIETALNKLGIYHFDQVGSLTDENIGWIEGHLGVPGRISRELWREQARELSAVLRPKRAAEK